MHKERCEVRLEGMEARARTADHRLDNWFPGQELVRRIEFERH